MKTKHNLRNLLGSVLAVILALFCIALFNVRTTPVKADGESSQIVTLFTPTADDATTENVNEANYTTSGFGDWTVSTTVEDHTDSPSGKVVRHTIDNTASAGGETWPSFQMQAPSQGDASGFAGYVIWLEYSGEMYSNDPYWGLFNFYVDGVTVDSGADITFIDEKGKITETQTNRWCYHHNNYTEIENSGYTYAYSYAFKGYMIVPAETFSSDVTPTSSTFFNFSHHYKKTLKNVDIKVGAIGYYTDYDVLLQELGRCEYSFVDHDGTVIDSDIVRPGTEIVAPAYSNSFVKNDKIYTFVGWRSYVSGMTISEDITFTASYKMTDFHMVKGASIRTNAGTSGIRFTAEFDENLYNEVDLDENKQFGMIITKLEYYQSALAGNTDLITGLNGLGNNKYVLITEDSANPLKVYPYTTETNVAYRINGALTNIQYNHADWTFIGVGVVITTDGENVSYTYAVHNVEDSARTASYVASAALNDPTEDFTTAEKTTLKNYVYKSAALSSGVTESDFEAKTDKSSYLSDYSLSVGEGFDTTHKFNQNVEGDEAYMAIGEKTTVDATIVNDAGNALDVAYTISVSDASVLQVNGREVKALKNGYATVTLSCELFGYSQTLTVYTGSTDAGNRATSVKGSNEGAQGISSVQGEIDGQTYYWTQYDRDDGQQLYASYSDISVYYIDHLLSQGYRYLRIPFYFDTTRYAELGGTADAVTEPYFTIWMAKQLNGTSGGSYKKVYVPQNEWCYYDMDLNHYRMNFSEVDGAGIDTYGIKTSVSSYYQYLNMKFSCAYGYVYVGNMTFVKNSTVAIDESNDTVSLGEEIDLADRYGIDENMKAYYTVDGVKMDKMTAVYKQHSVTICPNLYTANIGDGSYTVGTAAAWTIGCNSFTPIEKTLTVQDGLDVSATTLVDVNGITTDVSIGGYTGADELTTAGFDVTQTYVKRYSDGEEVVSATVANTERGIFYVSVSATKDSQTIEYELTLDLYNSTEAVEYESFGHADSKYAVTAYYALIDNQSTMMTTNGLAYVSYDTLKANYTSGASYSDNDCYGMDLPFDDYLHFNAFGDTSVSTYGDSTLGYWDDKWDSRNNLKTVYGLSGNTSAIVKEADLHYLAMDMSLINTTSPITSYVAMDTVLNIYVTPRHSEAYYKKYSSDTKLRYSYAVPWFNNGTTSEGDSAIIYAPTSIAEDGTPTYTKKQNYSAYFQSSIYSASTITAATIAEHYASFANRSFPMIISDRPQGFSSSNTQNGVLKLCALML